MPTDTQQSSIQRIVHLECFACGTTGPDRLGLVFSKAGEGRVVADCSISEYYQGYSGVVQGGIVATILDSAMTNCLFSEGIEALTAQLNVRYHKVLETGHPLHVEASLQATRGRLYELSATISQGGIPRASATAKFLAVTRVAPTKGNEA